jgi:dTDP-4-dehydrorhamnose reductase
MRTLVLGGTGMLGRAMVTEARSRSLPVLGLSHAQADIRDRVRLLYWVDAFRPELIVNCAAYTKVDACEGEGREAAFAINGEAVDNVVAAAQAVGARIVHISTDYVFDGRGSEPYREDDPVGPLSAYGQSKLDGERRALAHDRSTVVRTSWLFGAGGPNFVATIVRLIEEGKALRVVRDQLGAPTYTLFLARAVLDLAAIPAADVRGVVHFRNREPVSWYEFATEIAGLWSGTRRIPEVVPVTTNEFPRPAPRPAYSVLDVARFEEAAGRRVEPWGWGLVDYLAALRRERKDVR